MSKDARFVILSITRTLLVLGMLLCLAAGFYFPFWSKVALFLLGGYFACLVVSAYEILVFEREEKKARSLQNNAANSNDEIPRWIKIPVLSILFLLLGVIAVFFCNDAAFVFNHAFYRIGKMDF
jgi:hypothetical protein